MWEGLVQQNLGIPRPAKFHGVTSAMPYVIVGDEAFGLTNFLLTPYAGNHLPEKKRIFNYRLTLARRHVECTFGILTNKWRILHRALDTSVAFADDILTACCVPHNFVRERDGFQLELNIVGLEDTNLGVERVVGTRANVHIIRDTFADYFISNIGELSWQYTAVTTNRNN